MRLVTGIVVALAAGAAGAVWAQAQKAGVVPPGDWQTINRDFAATRYSPLTQINTSNVANLKLAWSFPMQGGGTSVPLAVNGIMYISNGSRVTAIDGENGMEVWSFSTSGATTTPLPTDAQAQAPAAPAAPAAAGAAPGRSRGCARWWTRRRSCRWRSRGRRSGRRTWRSWRRWPAGLSARSRVLARRRQAGAAHSLPDRQSSLGDRCANRQGGGRLRRERFGGHRRQRRRRPIHLQERRHRRRLVDREPAGRECHRQPARVRCRDRQEAVGVPDRSEGGREVQRHMGSQRLAEPPGDEHVGLCRADRLRARHRVSADRGAGGQLLRRRSAGEQRLWQLDRRGGCADRQVQVALPDRASRSVGLGHAERRRAHRSHRERPAVARHRARREDELLLRAESRERQSADPGAKSDRCRKAMCRRSGTRRRSRSR